MPQTPPGRDPWLERWRPAIQAASRGAQILELGCDDGRDTVYLVRAGLRVVATDISEQALNGCASAIPGADFIRHDLRTPLPFPDAAFGVVLASLCLHYFGWAETLAMAEEIRRCLSPGGLLLCRLNSTRDENFGARGHEMIEPNYYAVAQRFGSRKRFFDRAAVDALFARGWEAVSTQEMTIDRYELPKVVWETAQRKK
jgi:SAM-dependent methyltransferase